MLTVTVHYLLFSYLNTFFSSNILNQKGVITLLHPTVKLPNQKIKPTFACPPFVRTRTDAGKFSFAVDTSSSIQTRRAGAFVIICFTKEKFLNFCVYWVLDLYY